VSGVDIVWSDATRRAACCPVRYGNARGRTPASDEKEEVIQQMHSHYIAALVRSVVDTTEVRTS